MAGLGEPGRRAVRATLVDPAGSIDPVVVDPDLSSELRLERLGQGRGVIIEDGTRRPVLFGRRGSPSQDGITEHEVVVGGWRMVVAAEPASRAALRERARRGRAEGSTSGPLTVRAIIPGVVRSVAVAEGDDVAAGQVLLVVEAMKMQNELRAPRAGRVARVAVGVGQTIELGDLLVQLGD